MAKLDAGGSGGGGSTDSSGGGSDGGSSDGTETNAVNILFRLRENPEALLVSLMLGAVSYKEAKGLVTDQSVAEIVIGRYIFSSFLRPFAAEVFDAGNAVLRSLLFILFGSDYEVGISLGTTWGLVDIPIGLASKLTTFIDNGITELVLGIGAINQSIAAEVAGLGIAAPLIVAVVWALELSIVGLVLWTIVSSIDVPGVKAVQAIKSISKPLRNIMEWLI